MKKLVIYHKNCFDGICAAWVCWKKFGSIDVEYIPMNWGDNYDWIASKVAEEFGRLDIYFVDYSLPKNALIHLAKSLYGRVTVIEHHVTQWHELKEVNISNIKIDYDVQESGASLAWKHFFPEEELPNLVRYIKDRDLWLYKEYKSAAVNSFIQSHPMNIETYEGLYMLLQDTLEDVLAMGEAILRYKNTMVETMCHRFILKEVGGYTVPVVNASILYSEVGDFLVHKFPEYPFAAYYFDRDEEVRQWGLRSRGKFDVSEIAKKYGGGGHRNAAGFEVKMKANVLRMVKND